MLYAYDNVCQSNETSVDVQFYAITRRHIPVFSCMSRTWLEMATKKLAIRTVDTDVLILAISFLIN